MHARTFSITALLGVVLFLAGCAGTGRLRYESAQEAFQKGMELYDSGKYERAAEYFQAVFDFGRTHEWAADAQLYLARSYYENGEYILAASEYNRFAQIYRTDPRRADAEFERALSYYELSPPYQLDQTDTERAVEQFRLFMQRFPDHSLVDEAQEKVIELREKMAHKQFETGGLYERRELYHAAAISYETTFDQYPDTPWADDALLAAIRAYIAYSDQSIQARQPERLRKAVENYQRLVQVFPESPLVDEAEDLYEQAAARLRALDEEVPALAGS